MGVLFHTMECCLGSVLAVLIGKMLCCLLHCWEYVYYIYIYIYMYVSMYVSGKCSMALDRMLALPSPKKAKTKDCTERRKRQ